MNRLPLLVASALAVLSIIVGVIFFVFLRQTRPVEEVSTVPAEEMVARGLNWERRKNPDGTVSQTFTASVSNYQTESGSFEPIDTTLSPAPDSGGYQNTTNAVRSSYKAELQSEALNNIVKSTIGGVEIISGFVDNELGAVNRNAVSEVEDNQITYKNVYSGVDVRYTVLPGGVLEEFVLTEAAQSTAAALDSLTQELSLSSGKLEKREDGSIGIFDDDGQLLGFLPLPYMYEDNDASQFSEGLTCSLSHLQGGGGRRYRLSKVLTQKGKTWLSSPQRKFPLVIDATVYEGQAKDGYLYRQCTGGSYQDCRNSAIQTATSGIGFYVGQKWDASWGEWQLSRGYVSFPTDSIPDDATIDSTNLYLTLRSDSSDTDFDVKFYSGDWGDLDAADWNTGAVSEGVFRNTNGLSPGSTYSRSVNPSSIDKLGETQFRLTSSREEAGNQPSGLEDISFYSANHWNANLRPRLEVTFTGVNNPPNTPSNPSPTSGSNNQSVFSDLSWSGGDPDAGDTAVYDVYLKAGDSNFGGPVSSNQAATTYDPGTLAYGTTYYWRIVAKDGFGATSSGPVWNFSTVAEPTQRTVLGNPADGFLEKETFGPPSGLYSNCQEQMDAIKAQTPIVETGSSDHEVGFYSSDCMNIGWMSRMFTSFDTSDIPDGDTVYSATLYLNLENNSGIPGTTPPIVDFGVYSGQSCYGTLSDPSNPQDWLDPSDWNACGDYEGNIIENMAGIPSVSDTEYALPIHPSSISKTGHTQFRVMRNYPAEDVIDPIGGDSFDSYVNFYSADTFPARRPRLVIDTSSGCSNTAPTAPGLASPVNGAANVPTATTLSWNSVSGWGVNCAGNNNTYEVFLSDNFGRVNSMNSAASWGTVDEFTVSKAVAGLSAGTTYYWRIRTSNGAETAASPVWSFTTAAACSDTAPSVPILLLPTDGAVGVSTSPTVSWNAVASWGVNCAGNNNTYEVFLDTNPSPATSRGTIDSLTTFLNIPGLAGNTIYYWKVRAANGALFTDSSPVWSFTTAAPSGTISGFVWEDMGAGPHAGSGLKDADEDFYIDQSVEISCVSSGPSGYSQTHNTDTLNDGRYVCDNVPAGEEITVSLNPSSLPSGLYPSRTMLDGGVCINGGNSLCRITINAGDSHEISFGVWDNPSSGWMQVKDGDVYAASVNINIPSTTAEYEQWFIADTSAGGTRGGVAVAAGLISCNTYTSERGWEVASYSGGIGWPNLTASSGPMVINHMGDLTVDPAYISSNGLNSGLHVVVVDGGNLTITGDVKGSTNPNDYQIYAVLIVKGGQIIVQDSDNGNDQLKIKGALYAENGFDLTARTLSNNQKPAIVVEYDPSYILQTIPGLTTSGVSWREVR